MRGWIGAALAAVVVAASPGMAAAERVTVTGEVIDSWCYVSEIMYAQGTAHHQCALWCAAGGVPVAIRAGEDEVYVVLKLEGDGTNVANPRVLRIQTHQVTVEGDLHARDGVKYLVVDQVMDDDGIVNQTHQQHGIVPFGK